MADSESRKKAVEAFRQRQQSQLSSGAAPEAEEQLREIRKILIERFGKTEAEAAAQAARAKGKEAAILKMLQKKAAEASLPSKPPASVASTSPSPAAPSSMDARLRAYEQAQKTASAPSTSSPRAMETAEEEECVFDPTAGTPCDGPDETAHHVFEFKPTDADRPAAVVADPVTEDGQRLTEAERCDCMRRILTAELGKSAADADRAVLQAKGKELAVLKMLQKKAQGVRDERKAQQAALDARMRAYDQRRGGAGEPAKAGEGAATAKAAGPGRSAVLASSEKLAAVTDERAHGYLEPQAVALLDDDERAVRQRAVQRYKQRLGLAPGESAESLLPPPPQQSGDAAVPTLEVRIRRMFAKHRPWDSADRALADFAGEEATLLLGLLRRHGFAEPAEDVVVAPSDGDDVAAAHEPAIGDSGDERELGAVEQDQKAAAESGTSTSTSGQSAPQPVDLRERPEIAAVELPPMPGVAIATRVRRMYLRYRYWESADDALERFKGQEELLLKGLVKRHGPEPPVRRATAPASSAKAPAAKPSAKPSGKPAAKPSAKRAVAAKKKPADDTDAMLDAFASRGGVAGVFGGGRGAAPPSSSDDDDASGSD